MTVLLSSSVNVLQPPFWLLYNYKEQITFNQSNWYITNPFLQLFTYICSLYTKLYYWATLKKYIYTKITIRDIIDTTTNCIRAIELHVIEIALFPSAD